jgi:hypothetical protein
LPDLTAFVPKTRVELEHICGNLVPGHVFLVSELTVDAHAIRVRYNLAPPLPKSATGKPSVFWVVEAVDNLGNRYQDAGGAYGLSADGRKTRGVLSLSPVIIQLAISLEVTVTASLAATGEEHRCSFTVYLPSA